MTETISMREIAKQTEAVKKYPNFLKWGEDGVLEIYADHHMLSSVRKCEAYFEEAILNRLNTKGRSFALEFGQFFHEAMEFFYRAHRDNWQSVFVGSEVPRAKFSEFPSYTVVQNCVNWIQVCKDLWDYKYKMEEFATFKQYKNLGGWLGVAQLLLEYYLTHTNGAERLRVVGWELGFGRNREVPIIAKSTITFPFRAYLTGRIDLIVDDGIRIGPLDHKTTSYFDGSESQSYKPHEGMLGYAYAIRTIMGEEFLKQGKACNGVIINHISLKAMKVQEDRFKRGFKSWTPEEFDAFVLRQQRSFQRLYEIAVLGRTPDWNTEVCRMMWFRDCPFAALHEVTPSSRDTVLNQFYEIKEAWQPYKDK